MLTPPLAIRHAACAPSQGGNLLNLFYKLEKFDEDTARFYLAECVLAIEQVHSIGFAHRCVFLARDTASRQGYGALRGAPHLRAWRRDAPATSSRTTSCWTRRATSS